MIKVYKRGCVHFKYLEYVAIPVNFLEQKSIFPMFKMIVIYCNNDYYNKLKKYSNLSIGYWWVQMGYS